MKKFLLTLAFLISVNGIFAAVPTAQEIVFSINLKTEKVIAGIYSRFEKIEEIKSVLEDFDQIFLENAGINPRKDLRNLGALVIAKEKGFDFFGYLDGSFNPSRIIAEIEAAAKLLPPVAQKKVEINNIGDRQVIIFSDETRGKRIAAFFYNNDLLIAGNLQSISQLIENKTAFAAADGQSPELQKELLVKVDTIKARSILEKIQNPALIPVTGVLSMFNSLEMTIDRNDINVLFRCIDDDTAQNLKTFIEGQLAGYRMFVDAQLKNLQKPGKDPNWLPNAFKYLMGRSMALMTKKSLEQTKVVISGNDVILSTSMPLLSEGFLNPVTIGATGILAAIAVPNFQKARGDAQKKACFANQRVLLGAVEMYNMDHEKMMENLDSAAIELLASKKYLKAAPQCPAGGKYFSDGKLSADGNIQCTIHGGVE
ncbi:MAG: competence type IV pilus major pilin ComGC [Candidatus Rifleibacteriota bacterium]